MSRRSGGSRNHNEKATLPRPIPHVARPIPQSKWPQHYEKPDNVTWAKDPGTPKRSDSLELPLQGARNSEPVEPVEPVEPKQIDWGGYRFERGLK